MAVVVVVVILMKLNIIAIIWCFPSFNNVDAALILAVIWLSPSAADRIPSAQLGGNKAIH